MSLSINPKTKEGKLAMDIAKESDYDNIIYLLVLIRSP